MNCDNVSYKAWKSSTEDNTNNFAHNCNHGNNLNAFVRGQNVHLAIKAFQQAQSCPKSQGRPERSVVVVLVGEVVVTIMTEALQPVPHLVNLMQGENQDNASF